METFFQKPREEWTELEKRAFEEVQNICNRHDGDAEARYGAWEAMVWLSSQLKNETLLKEFVPCLEKQKDTSQEREQEDKKMLDSVIRIITQFDDLAHEPTFAGPKCTHPYTKELAWLKSLLLGGVYQSYDMAKAYVEGQYNILNNLNKYHHSFKPSEEHLSALLAVFNDPNNIGSQTCQLALTDLYEQLKKL